MKMLLLGNLGQLGWELHRSLQQLGDLVALDYPEIDMAFPAGIRAILRELHPDVIVNATAYTNVDKAETEPELALAINGIAPGVLAEEAHKLDAFFLHYSTDYIFDGKKGAPYLETDHPDPLNVYGKTKLAGEEAIRSVGGKYLIFRTAWVYSLRKESFVPKVLGWARKNESLRVVDDQISNPTWARMLAECTVQVLAGGGDNIPDNLEKHIGIYHLAGDGYTSRYEWAKKILLLDPSPNEQVTRELIPVPSKEFPTPAKRPLFSALDCTKFKKTFGIQFPIWELSLEKAMRS
jgi:dTDP-4-dehydrorhamnose reductase